MISLLFIWFITITPICLIGYSMVPFLYHNNDPTIDEVFFLGFLVISILSSFASIFSPLNFVCFLLIDIIALSIWMKRRKQIKKTLYKRIQNQLRLFDWIFILVLPIIFSLYCSSGIHLGDTHLYHSQSIQWINKFPVVPGLGNLHGRLAFNSMFFPISAIFTIDSSQFLSHSSILVYPLNAVAFIVLIIKEYFFIKKNILQKNWSKTVFGLTISFLCLIYLTLEISSPSTDVITAILIIYVFQRILEYNWETNLYQFTFLIGLVTLCITFKLSSALLLFLIVPLTCRKDWRKRLQILSIIGVLVISPFFIRSYYLSGYIIYPFSHIDIFNVDWKIPLFEVILENNWVKSWARIPVLHFSDVLSLSLNQWIGEWFLTKDILMQSILVCNVFSVGFIFYSLYQKNYQILLLLFINLSNLIFWFFLAPAPRFAYGFLFIGTALTLYLCAEVLKKFDILQSILFNRSVFLSFSLLLLVVIPVFHKNRILYSIQNPKNLVLPNIPNSFETRINETNFIFYSPMEGDRCFNSSIPCTPYPKENLKLRKKSPKDGFWIQN